MTENEEKRCSFLILQCDWDYVLRQEEGKVWVSLKHFGCTHPTTYGSIKRTGSAANGQPILEASDGFVVDSFSLRMIKISHPKFNIRTSFHAPVKMFHGIHSKSITSMDISKEGGLGVTASIDGTLHIWDTTTGSVRRRLEGHAGDVNCCIFFPSGLVVLSGGMDTQIKIWSAEDGSCARTLNGSHKCGILSVATVGKGRNIISASRDGSLKLWECSSASCIADLLKGKSEINFCIVTEMSESLEDKLTQNETCVSEPDNLEFDTDFKLVTACCESGEVIGLHLSKRSVVFEIQLKFAVNCCCYLDETTLVAGLQDGSIVAYDITNPSQPTAVGRICGSPVISMCADKNRSIWASFGDGRCSLLRITSSPTLGGDSGDGNRQIFEIVAELTGPDCDPVYNIVASKSGCLFTSCRDAIVRKYRVPT